MASLDQRFWNKVDKTGDCWEWLGSTKANEYGGFRFNGRVQYAHRVSWQLTNGEIPQGDHYGTMCVLHKCDNRKCVNPDHLFLGTVSENVADMDAKGRRGASKDVGSAKGTSVLFENDIPRIIDMLRCGATCQAIADLFAVGRATISDIKHGKTWQHVEVA